MRAIPFIAASWILVGLCGCVSMSTRPAKVSSNDETPTLRHEVNRLQKENKDLKDRLLIAEDRAKDLEERDRQLGAETARLKSEATVLRGQIDALREVPADRDRYRKLWESAQERSIQLNARVQELEHQLRALERATGRKAGELPKPTDGQ